MANFILKSPPYTTFALYLQGKTKSHPPHTPHPIMRLFYPLFVGLLLSHVAAVSAQSTMLYQRWKLVEIYQIDTMQTAIRQDEISALQHREQVSFHLREMGLENQYLIFSPDGLCYQLDRRLDNTVKLHLPQKLQITGQNLFFLETHEVAVQLHLTPSLLILGRNSTDIVVYVAADADIADLNLANDYIWEYIARYFPHRFRRYEEGIWVKESVQNK